MASIFIRRKEAHRHSGRRRPCDNRGRDWSDASTNQGQPKTACKHQQLEEARKSFPL